LGHCPNRATRIERPIPFNLERTVNSSEIHDQISTYVDERIDEAEYRNKVRGTITSSPDCRAAYEHELATRMVVHRVAEPRPLVGAGEKGSTNHVSHDGAGAVDTDGAPGDAVQAGRGAGFLSSPIGVVAAVAIVIASAVVLVRSADRGDGKIIVDEPQASTSVAAGVAPAAKHGPENLFNKSADIFSSILSGELAVQHMTSDQSELAQYFKENGVSYAVNFAPVHAPLEGGLITQNENTRLAHVVFTRGDVTVYLLEVPIDLLRQGTIVNVGDVVLKQLEGGKTLWEEPNGHRLAMFKQGELICAVVSNTSREDLERIIGRK
jgi:hypothetical protein